MSDIQRWHLNGLPGTDGMVEIMLYADHVAAVAAAEIAADDFQFVGWAKDSFDAGVKAARESVAAMRPETDPDIAHVIVSDVLDAIDALEEKP